MKKKQKLFLLYFHFVNILEIQNLSMMTSPSVGFSSRVMHFMRVDFPDPLLPMTKTNSPSRIANVTPRSASVPVLYVLCTFSKRIKVSRSHRYQLIFPPWPDLSCFSRYVRTMAASLKSTASSKERRSSPVIFWTLSRRYTKVFLCTNSFLEVSLP